MQQRFKLQHLIVCLGLVLGYAMPVQAQSTQTSATGFQLSSPSMQDGGLLPIEQVGSGQGCTGGNLSPALNWSGAPQGTKSFGLTVYDPDAPTGSGFWHWVVFNLPATVASVPAGAGDPSKNLIPQSVQSRDDAGMPGYTGACPSAGDKPHRYIFTLFALKVEALPLDQHASGALVGFYMNANVLAKTTLTVTYGRPSQLLLTSPGLPNGSTFLADQVGMGQGCTGANRSPALNWTGAPAGTKSFGVTMFDIDAPTGSGLWHWVVFNLPPETTALNVGTGETTGKQLPIGSIQIFNDTGVIGYSGPCPPVGDKAHHYLITLYALGLDKLPLDQTASGALVGFYLNKNALDKAFLTFTYGR